MADYVRRYNKVGLHSAIGYVTPADKLAGREQAIFAERDRKLEAARERRQSGPRGERPAVLTLGDRGRCSRRLAVHLRWKMAWAEDRAPWRHDPSADPGAKTEGGRHDAALSFPSGLARKR